MIDRNILFRLLRFYGPLEEKKRRSLLNVGVERMCRKTRGPYSFYKDKNFVELYI